MDKKLKKPQIILKKNKTTESDRSRFIAYDPQTDKQKKFGHIDYENYTIHKDDKRKQNYIKRHSKNVQKAIKQKDNYIQPAILSTYLLWNKKSLGESIKDYEKKFNIRTLLYMSTKVLELIWNFKRFQYEIDQALRKLLREIQQKNCKKEVILCLAAINIFNKESQKQLRYLKQTYQNQLKNNIKDMSLDVYNLILKHTYSKSLKKIEQFKQYEFFNQLY